MSAHAGLDAPISEAEVKAVVGAVPRWKAPGPDGITGAFYRRHRGILVPALNNRLKGSWDTWCTPRRPASSPGAPTSYR